MSFLPTALITSTGLVGGFQVARSTGNRPLGGAVLAGAGAVAFNQWRRHAGTGRAVALTGLYLGAFGASHPLAKKIGAWPSIYTVTAGTGLASMLFGRGRGRCRSRKSA